MTTPTDRRPRVLSGIQPTADSFHLGNYLGAVRAVGGPAGRPRRVLLHPGPARDHGRARPEDARRTHPQRRRPAPRARARPGPVHAVRPVARARARAAGMGARLHHGVRRGEPDDPVQGQDALVRAPTGPPSGCSPTRSCRPPTSCSTRPTGFRSARTSASTWSSPAISHSGSTPGSAAPSSSPSPTSPPGAAKIQDLQDPTAKMSKSASSPGGNRRAARRPEGLGQEDPFRGHRHRAGDPLRRGGQAGDLEPAGDLLGAIGTQDRRDRGRVRRAGLRRPQEGPRGRRRAVRRRRCASACGPTSTTRRSWTASSLDGAQHARDVAGSTLGRAYDRIGFLPPAS